jgi:hypothetical protein
MNQEMQRITRMGGEIVSIRPVNETERMGRARLQRRKARHW